MTTSPSIFVPLPMRVSSSAARSIEQLGPISTSSSITTLPDLRDLVMHALVRREAETIDADDRAGVNDHAIADDAMSS